MGVNASDAVKYNLFVTRVDMICFHCGKELVKITTGKRKGMLGGVVHDYHGNNVRSHVVCYEQWKRDLPLTAQEKMDVPRATD